MLVGRDEEEDAVVLLGLAELPGAEQRVGVGLDRLPVERRNGRDDQLNPRLALEIGELAFEIGALDRGKHMRSVNHAAGQSRRTGRTRRRRR